MSETSDLREQYRQELARSWGEMWRRRQEDVRAEFIQSGMADEEAGVFSEAVIQMAMQEMANKNFRGPM